MDARAESMSVCALVLNEAECVPENRTEGEEAGDAIVTRNLKV